MSNFDDNHWLGRTELDLPPGRVWKAIIEDLETRFPQPIYRLSIRVLSSSIQLAGEMTDIAALKFLLAAVRTTFKDTKVESKVVIAAPLLPADDDPFDDILPSRTPPQTAGAPEAGAEMPVLFDGRLETVTPPPPVFDSDGSLDVVTRYPSIRSDGMPHVGHSIELTIDLGVNVDSSTSGGPVQIRDHDPKWKFLDVEVRVLCAQLDFEGTNSLGTVTLFANRTSEPAVFKATVNELAKLSGHLDISAIFSFDGRASGSAHRLIALEAPAIEPSDETKSPPGDHRQGQTEASGALPPPGFALQQDADPPTLTVMIKQVEGNTDGMCIWAHSTTRAQNSNVRNWTGTIHLNSTAKEFAQSLLETCAVLLPGRHEGELRSAGEKIWRKVPEQFRQLYKELLETEPAGFSIQFVVNEAYIPWEMMCPETTSGLPSVDHLYHAHPVARWPMDGPASIVKIPKGRVASFVPTYQGDSLTYSLEEGLWLKDNLSALPLDPTWAVFTNLLFSPGAEPIQVVHFAGHGASTGAPGSLGLKMDDGWVSIGQATSSQCALGKRDHSLFVLNACEVGTLTAGLGAVDGWPTALTTAGFGGVVAPLWAVKDEHAAEMVKDFLGGCLKNNKTIAEALRTARQARKTKSATPFAYIFHGDVMAKMQH